MTAPTKWVQKVGRSLRLFFFKNDVLRSSHLRGDDRSIMRMYRYFAPIYDFIFPHFASFQKTIDRMNERFVPEGSRILDLGAGTGIVSLKTARKARHVVALDLAIAMLQKAQKKAKKQGMLEKHSSCQASALQLPYKDRRFDGVISSFMEVYLDIPQKKEMLREVHRILQPGGRVTFITGVGELSGRYILREKWDEILKATGFDDVQYEDLFDVYRLVSGRKSA